MKCYNCAKNQADNRFLVNHNGSTAEVYLCGECLGSLNQHVSSIIGGAWTGGPSSVRHACQWPGFDPPTSQSAYVECFPLDAGDEIKRKRMLGEFKEKLAAAVQAEDYETAAIIRDEIYRMEKEAYAL